MSISLDPVVAGKLRQFARRRVWLILARGLCAGLVTFLLGVTVVGFIDWYWLLSDGTRWLLSCAIYGPVIAVVWFTGLRRLIHLPENEETASQVEQTRPQLRENLLSAVELATDDPSAVHDSVHFRRLLQGEVAAQMQTVQVPSLLPVRLIVRWILAALILATTAALLLTSSDSRFRQLAARAIMPGANIARVSRIQVSILQPTPHSFLMAEDETVAVVVAIAGGSVNDVTLETFTEKQGSKLQLMRGRSSSEYVSNIHVTDEAVEYRILAGDAVTQRFRIESRPRPRVTAFRKTFRFPAYSLLPDETVRDTHGNLRILEGTNTELQLELNQPVSVAELRIAHHDSDTVTIVPLAAEQLTTGEVLWTATIPVDTAAIYKVHLISKETGFENTFSPKYEIRPQPDLIPRAGFVDQRESTLLLPPNDILALKAMAEDDLPLVSLEQQVSVNGQEWIGLSLDTVPADDTDGRRLTAEWQWDLLSHRLKTGDQVMTKLVATDRRGNRGESIPLRIIVAAQDFDPERHTLMKRKLGLYRQLADFAGLLEEHKTSALETIERLRNTDQVEEQAISDRTTLLELAGRQREKAAQLLTEIKNVEQDMPAGADAIDLELTGKVVGRLLREHTNVPAYLLKAMQHTDDRQRLTGDFDELKRAFERTADDAKNVAAQYQHLMSHNFLTAVAFDLDAMLKQQKLIVDSPTQSWDRLLRQETIVVNQLLALERLIQDQRDLLPNGFSGQMTELVRWSVSQRERLQETMESEDQLARLQTASQEVLRQLKDRQRVDVIDGGLPSRLIGAWRDLDNRSGSLHVPLEQLARAAQQENRLAAQAVMASDSAAGSKLLNEAERFVAEVDLKHRRSLDQLRTRRELTQARRDSDSQYAADAGLTHRAVTSLLNQHRTQSPQDSVIPDNLLEIAPAYRILEAGHELIVARDVMNLLLNLERWDSQSPGSRLDHPRQWDLVQRGFELAVQRLREAGVKNEIVGQLDQVRWSASVRDAGRKISERRWKRDLMVSAGHELVAIQSDLEKVVEALQPVMSDARAVIAKFAPTIPEMAEQAAAQVRELEDATIRTADSAEQIVPEQTRAEQSGIPSEKPPAATPELSQLQDQQNSINQQIQDLIEALVEDANSQDLMEDSQRERARDADNSIAMIMKPADQMKRAMEKALDSPAGAQQAADLAQAAEQQEKTAQALDRVAGHFSRLNEGIDVAESRAELRQAEQAVDIANRNQELFDDAQQFAQMAGRRPDQLMAELEAELQQNPAMQQALSEISRNTLEEARNALEFSAQDEHSIRQANERSDVEFQNRKRALAEDLREMAAEASRLSGALVAQAGQSAAQGKTTEAQQKFAQTQQKLNEVSAAANSAREEQLLSELAVTARDAKAALAEATDTLKQAKQQTEVGRNTEIHADEKAREAQKKDSENRRRQFHEQQKRTAADLVKRADDTNKRAEQAVQNARKEVNNADQRLQQARERLNGKPDDAGLKRSVEQEVARHQSEQQKLAAAENVQRRAEQKLQQQRQQADRVNSLPQPALDAPNPAAQLADHYAEEAIRAAERLTSVADQLIGAAAFDDELTPRSSQLAYAEQQQQQVIEDVENAATDVARAARHERRLQNAAVAQPLQEAADSIQRVARNESRNAERGLNAAAAEAEQATANSDSGSGENRPQQNTQSLRAQQDLAASENAITQEARQLAGVIEPLIAAAAGGQDGNASGESAGEPDGAPAGESASGQSPMGSPTSRPLTPDQIARGQQLARTLDELDRQQAAAAATAALADGLADGSADGSADDVAAGQPNQQTSARLETLAQAARSRRAALATSRLQAQQIAAMAIGEGGMESSDSFSAGGPPADFGVAPVNRNDASNWGRLRNKSAEDLTKGRSEMVSEEYRKSIETYFRVLAERAKK